MNTQARRIPILAVACLLATPGLAQSTTWTGAVSHDWTDAGNWTGGVPTAGVGAKVVAAPRQPVVPSTWPPYECGGLAVAADAGFTGTLRVYGDVWTAGHVHHVWFAAGSHDVVCSGHGEVASLFDDSGATLHCRDLVAGGLSLLGGTCYLGGRTVVGTMTVVPQFGWSSVYAVDATDTWRIGSISSYGNVVTPQNVSIGSVQLGGSSGFGTTGGVIRILPDTDMTIVDGRAAQSLALGLLEVPASSGFHYSSGSMSGSLQAYSIQEIQCDGSMTFASPHVLVVDQMRGAGTITLSGASFTTGGAAGYQPTPHVVHGLDLTGELRLEAGAQLRLVPDAATPNLPFVVQAGAAVRVQPSSTAGARLIATGDLHVLGLLEIGTGCEFEHRPPWPGSPCSTTIDVGGTLRLSGLPGAPAIVSGTPQSDFSLDIAGRIEAHDYEIRDAGASGLHLLATAQLGAAPFDLRHGRFTSRTTAAQASLLTLERAQSTALTDIVLDLEPGGATFGVRAATPQPVTIAHGSGGRAGSANDDDPFGVVQWLQEPCWLAAAGTAIGGGDEAVLPPVSMGFSFPFAGQAFDRLHVSTNGFLYLGQAGAPSPTNPLCCNGAPGTLAGATQPIVAPFWHDLASLPQGTCRVEPGAERCVVTWVDFVENGSQVGFELQVTLHASGDIEFRYPPDLAVRTPGTALVGLSPGGGSAAPVASDLSAAGFVASPAVFEQFDMLAHPFDLAGATLRFEPFAGGYRCSVATCTPAVSSFGQGCGGGIGSVHEAFADPAAFDLSNRALRFVRTPSGYDVVPATAALVPPTGPWWSALPLGDDEEVVQALAQPLPLPVGQVSQLVIGSNGYVTTSASGFAADKIPSGTRLLAFPGAAWAVWRDFVPAGNVWFEQGNGHAYATWQAVASFGATSSWPPPPTSTFQLQFELATGNVTFVFESMDTAGAPSEDRGYVVGFSPGNAAPNMSIDLSAVTSLALAVPERNLRLALLGAPAFGATVSFATSDVPPGTTLGAVALGVDAWANGIDLTAIGMTRCTAYVAPLDWLPFVVPGPNPVWSVTDDPSTLDLQVFAQSIALAPVSNPAQLVTSNVVLLRPGW